MELKACPFCGSENVEERDCDEGFSSVFCHNCEVTVCSCKTNSAFNDIADIWNRRAKDLKTVHCMKCGAEIWGNRIFDINIGKEHSLLCPVCVKGFALDLLGRAWMVERMAKAYDEAEIYEGEYTAQTPITMPEEEQDE